MDTIPTIFRIQVSKVIDGRYCTFIEGSDGKPASPITGGLYELIPWMRENGWVSDKYDYQGNNYEPWRVSKAENKRYRH